MRWKSKISYMALCTIALMSCDKEESCSDQNSINDVFSDFFVKINFNTNHALRLKLLSLRNCE